MKSNIQVAAAAFFGSLPSATLLFLEKLEPIFRLFALAGQVGVAAVTIWYIVSKTRAVLKNKQDDE